MGCFSCCLTADDGGGGGGGGDESRFSLKKSSKKSHNASTLEAIVKNMSLKSDSSRHRIIAAELQKIGNGNANATKTFTFKELANATKNFKTECLVGEGGFGRVYKGFIESTNQVVAVKQLDRNGLQGNREFLVEVLMLSLVHHPNLVNLVGYCADGDQRILVYEYMPLGSLEDHLLDLPPTKKALDWNTRMKIAQGAAKGLEYLHDAQPLFKDRRKFTLMADPLLEGNYPIKGLYQALAIAAMCLQEESTTRPLISDVVTALEYLAAPKQEEEGGGSSHHTSKSHSFQSNNDGEDSEDDNCSSQNDEDDKEEHQ
ncbi:hypothetical protein MKW92_006202 [Papaver armeniacum]|nr:hypothetical protein MKW92_006202 [Papaver armeniacum]